MTNLRRFTIMALGCILFLGACDNGGTKDLPRDPAPEVPDIAEVLDRHADRLVAIDGVSAVGLGTLPQGQQCVRIFVIELTDELRALLPGSLEGHPVDFEVSGEFVPVDEPMKEEGQ